MVFASAILSARKASRLSADDFARLTTIEPARLHDLEAGVQRPTPAELDRCARLLGLRVKDLLQGESPAAPMAPLLKLAWPHTPISAELESTGAHRVLGEFGRVARDIADLRSTLGESIQPLPAPPVFDGSEPFFEQRSRWLRESLNLGDDPIPSVRAVLAGLDVGAVFVDHALSAAIAGASLRVPAPIVLVNLVRSGQCWWRTRMTLLHELAHLLFDMNKTGALFSPERGFMHTPAPAWPWRIFDGFAEMEVAADGFAATFLAPASAVRTVVGDRAPDSDASVQAVGCEFGLGKTVAIRRLTDVFGLSPSTRAEMQDRAIQYDALGRFDADRVSEGEIGLRRGNLHMLVERAYSAQVIGAVQARRLLGIALSEPLKLNDEPVWRMSMARRVMLMAQKYLSVRHAEDVLVPVGAEAEDGGWWRVTIGVQESAGVTMPWGVLKVQPEEGRLCLDVA